MLSRIKRFFGAGEGCRCGSFSCFWNGMGWCRRSHGASTFCLINNKCNYQRNEPSLYKLGRYDGTGRFVPFNRTKEEARRKAQK